MLFAMVQDIREKYGVVVEQRKNEKSVVAVTPFSICYQAKLLFDNGGKKDYTIL